MLIIKKKIRKKLKEKKLISSFFDESCIIHWGICREMLEKVLYSLIIKKERDFISIEIELKIVGSVLRVILKIP